MTTRYADNETVAELEELQQRVKATDELLLQCIVALKDLFNACPTSLECNSFHHTKINQHEYNERCGPQHDYLMAITHARKSLAAINEFYKGKQ